MTSRIRNLRRTAAVMVVLAVLGGAATAPVAHAAPKTTDSGKKWK